MASPALGTRKIMVAWASSETMPNAFTVRCARRFEGTSILIDAVHPGLVASDFIEHHLIRKPGQGAAGAIRHATLLDGGPTGGFHDEDGETPR